MPIPGTSPKETVPETMQEWGSASLHSGKGGKVIPHTRAGQRQAIAIGYSYARRNAAENGHQRNDLGSSYRKKKS